MLKVGVIGLGNIAQKAYLPVYSQMQDQVEWHLISRNAEKLAQIQQQYGFQHGSTNQADLLNGDIDAVFIHTPTPTHYAIIKQFLEHGIHVFVDKPVSEILDEVEELYQIAEAQGVLLTCGFNRRFVPMHEDLAKIEAKHSVNVVKTRELENQDSAFAIYDLMIHVVDLMQFLLGSQNVTFTDGQIVERNGALVLAQLNVTNGTQIGSAKIDMMAGVNQEQVEVVSDSGVTTADNLRELTVQAHGKKILRQAPDWQVNLATRGFKPLIERFIDAVMKHQANPVSPASSIQAHALCARLISDGKVLK
jgi:virulence factor